MSPFSLDFGVGVSPNSLMLGHNGGPPLGDWPSALNTGPTGPLTPMSGEVRMWDGDGSTVLENVELTGWIIIQSPNCKIRNCKITTDGGDFIFSCIRIDYGSGGSEVGLEIKDCEINGSNNTVNGFLGSVDPAFPMVRNNIYGVHNGINCGSGTYKDNFITITLCAQEDAHYDCFEMNGALDLVIEHNRADNQVFQTSALMLANVFYGIINVTVHNNWLSGGGYTLYCDPRFGGGTVDAASIHITGNKMGAGGYGYFALYDTGVIPVGNYDEVTGADIDP